MITFCIIIFLNLIVLTLLINLIYSSIKTKNAKKYAMSFQTSIDLANLPIVTFYQGNKKYNFLLDTGTMGNIIDSNCDIIKTPIEGNSTITGTTGEKIFATFAKIKLYYKELVFNTETQVTDMSKPFQILKQDTGVTIHGLLGTDFFKDYGYVLDYYDMIAYPKKIK